MRLRRCTRRFCSSLFVRSRPVLLSIMVQLSVRRYLLGHSRVWAYLALIGFLHTSLVTQNTDGEVEFSYGWAGVEVHESSEPEGYDEALQICCVILATCFEICLDKLDNFSFFLYIEWHVASQYLLLVSCL